MIWYITGKPRSGKTYYAVYKIKGFADSDRYDNIYTNIGGFKFDKFDKVKKLDFEHFFDVYVPELYKEFKKAKKTMDDYDDWIVNKVKEDGYYRSAFFVDEAQEYLANERVHLRWLFSYQGHLGFDFYFITQALGLVHAKYKYTVESVYNSVSSSYKIFSNLFSSPLLDKLFGKSKLYKKIKELTNYGVYQIYATTKMTRTDKVSTFRLPMKKEIFDIYKSGDVIQQKSPILGRLLIILLLILGLYFYFKYFTQNMFHHKSKSKDNPVSKTVLSTSNTHSGSKSLDSAALSASASYENKIIIPVSCRNDYCSSKFFQRLPYGVLKKYKDDLFRIIYFKNLKYSTDLYIETTEENMKVFSPFSSSAVSKKSFLKEVWDD
jgi:zona occludens toxin